MRDKLIKLVKENPCLYNPSAKDYRNQQVRKVVWDEIAMKLDTTANQCRDNWTKLRNTYTNSLKRRLSRPSTAPLNTQRWDLGEQMSFLRHLAGHAEEVNVGNNDESDDEEVENKIEIIDNKLFFACDIPSTSFINDTSNSPNHSLPASPPQNAVLSAAPTISNIENRKRKLVPVENEVVKRKKESCTTPFPNFNHNNNSDSIEDEMDMFFLSLAKSVKKLNREEQVKVKLEICNAVFQAELRDIQQSK